MADTATFDAALVDLCFGPYEGFGILIVGLDEGIDVLAKLGDGVEGRTVRRLALRIENQISTWLNQEARVGVKWNCT